MLNVQASALTSCHAHSNTTTTQYAKFPLRQLSVTKFNASATTHGAEFQLPRGSPMGASTFGGPLAQAEALAEAQGITEADAQAEAEALAEPRPVPCRPIVKRYGFVDIVGAAVGSAPQLDFVLPGLLKGHTGGFVAPGGSSKGHLTMGSAIASALGIEVCGGLLPAAAGIRKTLILQAEDDVPALSFRMHVWIEHIFQKPDIRKRFRTKELLAQAVAEQFRMCAIPSSQAYLRDENNEPTGTLEKLRDAGSKYDIIMLDPLRRFLRGNENDSETVTKFISELETISGKTGVSFLLVHHANKASTALGAGMSQNAIRGSSALTDALRYQLNMQTMSAADAMDCKVDPSEAHKYVRVAMTKCNHSSLLPPAWAERLPGGVLERVELRPATKSEADTKPYKAKKSSAGAKFVAELFDDE